MSDISRFRRSERFFYKNAGFSYPSGAGPYERRRERQLNATQLAKAQCWVEENDDTIRVVWREDPEPYPFENNDPSLEVFCCFIVRFPKEYLEAVGLRNDYDLRAGEVLESLCGIVGPDYHYMRVVQAELALQAMDV